MHKTCNKFSAMALDQCHEQNNAMDGVAVVQMLSPGTSKTLIFQEYGEKVFASYIYDQREKNSCIDLVWDVYLAASLKATTREKNQEEGSSFYCDAKELDGLPSSQSEQN